MKKIMLTGALGQLGSEVTIALRKRYGTDNVIATDIKKLQTGDSGAGSQTLYGGGPFYIADCTDGKRIAELVSKHNIDTIYHLAALLSATSEAQPLTAWDLNMSGLVTVLEVAREAECSVFIPSSIGSFGPTTIKTWTPQDTLQRPTSMYGITKVAGELLCDYYNHRYGVDTRGLRYPGLISNVTKPGGGTTDYAVEIYYAAVERQEYTCFLKGDTYLDMMYMPDAVKAAVDLMEADPAKLRHRNAFNVTAMSFCPEDQAAYIRRYIPEFDIHYAVDPVRQAIANSWPNNMEDYAARVEWGWEPEYDLDAMTRDMLEVLTQRKKETGNVETITQ